MNAVAIVTGLIPIPVICWLAVCVSMCLLWLWHGVTRWQQNLLLVVGLLAVTLLLVDALQGGAS